MIITAAASGQGCGGQHGKGQRMVTMLKQVGHADLLLIDIELRLLFLSYAPVHQTGVTAA